MPTRILIVDDNAVFRGALRQVLEGVDYWDIVEAQDGQEAISKAVEIRPNVVILDLAMPVKDGLATARELSQLLPDTPIVMCTMHMSPHLEGEALKSGVRKVLSKSNSTLLIEAVRQFLPAPETAVPAAKVDPLPPPSPPDALNVAPAVSTTPAEAVAEPPSPTQPKNVA
jgi:two-component system response regulator NreC